MADLGFDLKVEDEASSSKDPSPTTSVAKDSTTTNYLPRRSSLTHAVTELNLDEDVLRQLAEAGEDIPGENGSSVPRIPPEKPKKDLAITPPDPSSPHTRAPLASPPAHNSSILLNGITEIASPLPGEEAVEPLDKIYLFSKSDLVNHRIWVLHEMPLLLRSVHPTEAVEYVLEILLNLSRDSEISVRQALAENLDQILAYYIMFCPPAPNASPTSRPAGTLPPFSFRDIVHYLLLDPGLNVSATARESIVRICSRTDLEPPVIEAEILKGVVLEVLHAKSDIVGKPETCFLALATALADTLDPPWMEREILPKLRKTTKDAGFAVRRDTVSAIAALTAKLPEKQPELVIVFSKV